MKDEEIKEREGLSPEDSINDVIVCPISDSNEREISLNKTVSSLLIPIV
jgi:hypothetical protein